MKLNQSVTRSFPILLLILLLFVGCGEDLPETATVMVGLSSPKVLKPADALDLTISTDFTIDFQGSLSDKIIYIDIFGKSV